MARPVNAESHYLHYNLNDLNAEKISALTAGDLNPLEPQATPTRSLGISINEADYFYSLPSNPRPFNSYI